MPAKKRQQPPIPDRAAVLDFIRESESPVGKREIARAFRLSGPERIDVADLLDELEEEGSIRRARGRRYVVSEHVPSVAVLDVTGLDEDGEPVVSLADQRLTAAPRIHLVTERRRGRAPGPGDRVLARLSRQANGEYAARIMRVLESRPSRVFGIFRAQRSGGRLQPVDRRIKSEFLIADTNTGEAADGDLVACETLPGRAFGLPLARVVERIGQENDARSVSPLVIARHEIPDSFAPEALREAERCGPAPMDRRDDLRELPLVTIDGEDARDFDDAVWAEADDDPKNPGGWHLMVAIADVAWYVRAGGALDEAARERGNSVYLPDRVVPMLPEALSNGWCSLVPGEDRPCLAVDIWIDAKGNKRRHRFRRAMMRSAARLSYTQVQRQRDGKRTRDGDPVPAGLLDPLYGAFAALFEAREARGAIDLDMPERRIRVADDGTIADVETRVRYDSHRLIEEFMITANVCAAETLEAKGQPCMYRLHDDPAPDRVAALRGYLSTLGLRLGGGQAVRPRHYAQLVARLRRRPDAIAIQEAILRSQSKAEYGPENLGHFGLALRNYAHFTSPIRRYSDLLVHRGLIAGLGLGAGGLDRETGAMFAEIGAHISKTERRAMAAEREAFDRLATLYLADRVGAHFPARITGVESFGLFVELDETGASCLMPMSALGEERFEYDSEHRTLRSRSGETFRLGDRIVVRLAEANVATGSMLVELPDRERRPEERLRRGPRRSGGRRQGRR